MKRIAILVLLGAALLCNACLSSRPEINVIFDSNLKDVISAVNNGSTSLEQKLAAIEQAVKDGNLQGKQAIELLQQAIASVSGSLSDKLAAIEAAIKSQTTSLETKISLIEAAFKSGFADEKTAHDLIKQALESIGGTAAEKLAAIETAIKSANTPLEAKLALIETALTEGFAAGKTQQELIADAVAALQGSMEEKLEAISGAISSKTTSLEAKIDLIEAAIAESAIDPSDKYDLIVGAIETLQGSMEEKLGEIQEAIGSRTTSLETKLGLIETAIEESAIDPSEKYDLIQTAIETLQGSMEEIIGAIQEAMTTPDADLLTKLEAIEAAITTGFANNADAQGLINTAIETLQGSMEEKLGALETAVSSQTTSLTTKLEAIETAVNTGFANNESAIELIQTALGTLNTSVETLGTNVTDKLTAINEALDAIAATVGEDLPALLSNILEAVQDVEEFTDGYEEILVAILAAINDLVEKIYGPQTVGINPVIALPDDWGNKTGWEEGDVIFVFLHNFDLPKYLRLEYDGEEWSSAEMDGANESAGCLGLSNGGSGTLTAIYLPAEDVTISDGADGYVFSRTDIPWYLSATAYYTVEKGRVKVADDLNFELPEGYFQMWIGDDADHTAELREPRLTPHCIASVSIDGSVNCVYSASGAPVKGVYDENTSGYFFTGMLDSNVLNHGVAFNFTLVRGGWQGRYFSYMLSTYVENIFVWYCNSVLNQPSTYPANLTEITDYKPIDLGCDVNGKRIYWCSRNIGAQSDTDAGGYYAWGETETKDSYTLDNYKFYENGVYTKYTEAYGTLLLDDDVAYQTLGGAWRMPTLDEMRMLWKVFIWSWDEDNHGQVVRSYVSGYDGDDGPYIFLPAAGCYKTSGIDYNNVVGYYWAPNKGPSAAGDNNALLYDFNSSGPNSGVVLNSRYEGRSVRAITE